MRQAKEAGDEARLLLIIHAKGDKVEVRSSFSKVKSEWWFKAAENFLDKLSLEVAHPEFSTNRAVSELEKLIGSVEAPPDWSTEYDHYLLPLEQV